MNYSKQFCNSVVNKQNYILFLSICCVLSSHEAETGISCSTDVILRAQEIMKHSASALLCFAFLSRNCPAILYCVVCVFVCACMCVFNDMALSLMAILHK